MYLTLSSPNEAMLPRYDAVVIGSGYGGAIAASRLARAGRSVCLLERGAERPPGTYPQRSFDLVRDLQVDTPRFRVGSRSALFDFRYNKDINVILGCGLGGTSLINAGISLRPDPEVFKNVAWPPELREPERGRRALYFDHADRMLRPSIAPDTYRRVRRGGEVSEPLAKPLAVRVAAQHSGWNASPASRAGQLRALRRRPQSRRGHSTAVRRLRRLRVRLQLPREEHVDHELPAGRQAPRRAHLHAGLRGRGEPSGPRLDRARAHTAQAVHRRRGHRDLGRWNARQHRDPAAFAATGTAVVGAARTSLLRQRGHHRLCVQQRAGGQRNRLRAPKPSPPRASRTMLDGHGRPPPRPPRRAEHGDGGWGRPRRDGGGASDGSDPRRSRDRPAGQALGSGRGRARSAEWSRVTCSARTRVRPATRCSFC